MDGTPPVENKESDYEPGNLLPNWFVVKELLLPTKRQRGGRNGRRVIAMPLFRAVLALEKPSTKWNGVGLYLGTSTQRAILTKVIVHAVPRSAQPVKRTRGLMTTPRQSPLGVSTSS